MTAIKNILKSLPIFKKIIRNLNNQFERDDFVLAELQKIQAGHFLLDAGCGSQRYREHCSHLSYKAQDFGQYTADLKKMMHNEGVGGKNGYNVGPAKPLQPA